MARTSLVFNFQFSFNCPFLGGFTDFHNSFQPKHHSAHPAARPLPRGAPCTPTERGGVREAPSAMSTWALSRAAQEVTDVQLGGLLVCIWLCLLHTAVYRSQAEIKPRKGCKPRDPLAPPTCCAGASDKAEESGSGCQWPSLWYSIAEM